MPCNHAPCFMVHIVQWVELKRYFNKALIKIFLLQQHSWFLEPVRHFDRVLESFVGYAYTRHFMLFFTHIS